MPEIDKIDQHILRVMQRQGNISMFDLGKKVGLSHTPCWRRVKRLEQNGYISKRVALLDAEKLGMKVNVFVWVTLARHQENAMTRFEKAAKALPEIVECYTVSGQADFLLRVVVEDVNSYDHLLRKKLIHLPEIGNLNSTIALEQVKYTTELPLP